ncbi:hypothetical protein MMC07_005360 [Pseudocyphellaria aurata]|nr:hypothetical protein [Pseudocyphellaria aurata]
MSSDGIASVQTYSVAIKSLLDKARLVKVSSSIEPALNALDFAGDIEQIGKLSNGSFIANNQAHYAAIETACRNIFYDLLASTTIDEPAFSEIWNLLDIVSLLSDIEQCEPGLVFWLVEELLDSQTIDGCRSVFDYLDSRREQMTAKHFNKKELIILRACNELLRRLSRAEDAVFCGRVFIFLFQSFPLGDRSSVNLRGEYHVENVTIFEDLPAKVEPHQDGAMEIDKQEEGTSGTKEGVEPNTESGETADNAEKSTNPAQEEAQGKISELDTLYPIFWSLQESFSMPTRLFDTNHFQVFKNGLDLTIRKFQAVHQELQARGTSRQLDESKRPSKRKRNSLDEEVSNSINPRYLTSRDLFDLEISDLAFRRYILVQALILVDFLLSLTPKAKRKLEHATNKSVLYSFSLSEEDAKWAAETRTEITTYLQHGAEGKFYYRMVDTVLSRDKNWAHWKAEGCPLIERVPVSADEFVQAQTGAQKACANKKLRATPMGSLDLKFLSDGENADGLEKLKHPDRYSIPTAESFRGPIADDEFDIAMAKTDEEKQMMLNARASKMWRTLRIASKSKLGLFDKIDDGNNIQALFQPEGDENRGKEDHPGSEPPVKDTTPTVGDTVQRPLSENGLEVAQDMSVK